jgi:hypothetical protein
MTPFAADLLAAFTTVVLTLIGKWVWDRWLSPKSRITEQKCKDNQAICFLRVTNKINEITIKIGELSGQLVCGDENFEKIEVYQNKTSHTLKLILMTLSDLCAVGGGCNPETVEDLRQEILN